jgi:hypothetical protein
MNPFMVNLHKSRDGANVICYDRLRQGSFYADFRRDKRLYPEVYHCIIQKDGSTQILSWSQFRTIDRARLAAERELQRLAEAEALKTKTQA